MQMTTFAVFEMLRRLSMTAFGPCEKARKIANSNVCGS